MSTVVEIVTLLIVLGMTYALVAEGAWGATLMFFNCLFAGLITFNFYEPLAALIAENVEFLNGFADAMCILLIYAVSLLVLRLTTDAIAPGNVRFPTPVYYLGALVFGFGAAAITGGMILLAFQAAPVHKKVFGSIAYDTKPPFGLGLDHQWLSFFQFSSGVPFARFGDDFRADAEYGGRAPLNLFDPKAEWLIRHQEARPVGEGPIGEEEGGATGGGAGPAPAGGSGGPMAGGQGQGGGPGMGIPGGTAGAAVGLAPTGP